MQRYCLISFLIIVTLVLCCGCFTPQSKSPDKLNMTPSPTVTTITLPTTLITTIATTVIPTPTPETFPNALKLKQFFNFSSGKSTSQGTVYRYWINNSYQVFNPQVTHYETKYPALGNKYLIIFVNIVDLGTTRLFPPKSSNIAVYYNGAIFFPDPTHDLPQSANNIDSPPIILRIGEIESFHKLDESEYVEDFGYSRGMEQAYLLPGQSNAIDGYIIYEVPASLTPDKTFVKIIFNSQDSGVWRLA